MKIQNAYFIIWNSSKNNFSKIYNDVVKKCRNRLKSRCLERTKKLKNNIVVDLYI